MLSRGHPRPGVPGSHRGFSASPGALAWTPGCFCSFQIPACHPVVPAAHQTARVASSRASTVPLSLMALARPSATAWAAAQMGTAQSWHSTGARTPCDITALPHASVTPLVTSPPCLPQRQQNRISPEGAQRAWKMASQPMAVKHSQEQGAHQEQAWCHQCHQCHPTAPRREFLGTASPLGLRRSCRHKGNGVLPSLLSSPDPAGKGQQEVSAAPQLLQSLCSKQISISQGALTAPPLLWFAVG